MRIRRQTPNQHVEKSRPAKGSPSQRHDGWVPEAVPGGVTPDSRHSDAVSPGRKWLRRGLLCAIATPIIAIVTFFALDAAYPFPKELLAAPPTSPRLFARDTAPVQILLTDEEQWRQPVPLAAISPALIEATIAVEDQRFRDHLGVDPLAILRALRQNILGGRTVSGASTITMQWVKMRSGNHKR
ncbi:MAG: transglycosylase domain-containing protein, partial [Planctomycetota bacterium]|nr:transglycosylase domain-containing protein [Planctomycetota bacterium]